MNMGTMGKTASCSRTPSALEKHKRVQKSGAVRIHHTLRIARRARSVAHHGGLTLVQIGPGEAVRRIR